MNRRSSLCLTLAVSYVFCAVARAQTTAQTAQETPVASSDANAQAKNIQEYIELLRTNVRQRKAEIMGVVMQLDADQAAKFWPIYSEYDAELTKLNNLRIANIQEYARNYNQMTDPKADELMQNALGYRKQRSELLAKYYGRVKASLGAVEAARFVQIEDQLVMLIDLQISSGLPVIGQAQ